MPIKTMDVRILLPDGCTMEAYNDNPAVFLQCALMSMAERVESIQGATCPENGNLVYDIDGESIGLIKAVS